ncbi:MAG: hypothetical protein AAFQ37_04790 [Bacteroidota bacterium]
MYEQIRKGAFLEGPNGPAIFRTNVIVPLILNQREYKLEERSTIENNFLVGIWVTKPATTIQTNLLQASAKPFESAALTLRVDTHDVVRKLYLQQIYQCNLEGKPYHVSIPGKINLVESILEIFSEGDIVANSALELQFDYVKEHPRHRRR